jgi:hypothetical protein
MKILPDKLSVNGFQYEKVIRIGMKCIYCQKITPDIFRFEVFIVKVQKSTYILGRLLLERETFPKNKDFGKTAWCCITIKDAIRRFNKIKGPRIPQITTTKLIKSYSLQV